VWAGDAWSKETRRASLLFLHPEHSRVASHVQEGIEDRCNCLAVDELAKSSPRAASREGSCGFEEPECFLPFRNPISRRRPLTARDLVRRIARAELLRKGTRRLLFASTDSPPQHAAAPV